MIIALLLLNRYVLDDEGNMTEYQPETSICAVQLDSQGNISEEDSNDTNNSETNDVSQLEDPTQLGMISCHFYHQNL